MRNIVLRTCALCLVLAGVPAGAQQPPPPEEGSAQDLRADDLAAIRNRILTSLMYRGQVADTIMEAGKAHELVVFDGEYTHADMRLALIRWIEKHPDKAARLALDQATGVKYSSVPSSYTVETWKVNDAFMAKVRALTAAAKDSSLSPEALELAVNKLYAGSSAGAGTVEVGAGGGGGPAASAFFGLGNTDYNLNRAGLERELAGAGALLDSLRGSGRGPAGAEGPYAAAVKKYGDFLVAASAMKGRDKITAAESAALEAKRAGLQAGLSALAVRVRAADARNIGARLEGARARPGGAALLAAAEEMRKTLEAEAGRVEAGTLSRKEQFSLARRAEEAFAAFYVKYSVYAALLGLKTRSENPGFSCLYDYLFWLWLDSYCPAAGYARDRAALRAAAGGLDEGLNRAGAGELEAALEGPGGRAAELEAALDGVAAAAARNRLAQYLLWDIILRPVTLQVSVRSGRAVFRPEFAFYGVVGRRPAAPNSN